MTAAPVRVAGEREPDILIDRLLKPHGRWLLMATLIGLGDATEDDDRLARAEYADARAAVAYRMQGTPTFATVPHHQLREAEP